MESSSDPLRVGTSCLSCRSRSFSDVYPITGGPHLLPPVHFPLIMSQPGLNHSTLSGHPRPADRSAPSVISRLNPKPKSAPTIFPLTPSNSGIKVESQHTVKNTVVMDRKIPKARLDTDPRPNSSPFFPMPQTLEVQLSSIEDANRKTQNTISGIRVFHNNADRNTERCECLACKLSREKNMSPTPSKSSSSRVSPTDAPNRGAKKEGNYKCNCFLCQRKREDEAPPQQYIGTPAQRSHAPKSETKEDMNSYNYSICKVEENKKMIVQQSVRPPTPQLPDTTSRISKSLQNHRLHEPSMESRYSETQRQFIPIEVAKIQIDVGQYSAERWERDIKEAEEKVRAKQQAILDLITKQSKRVEKSKQGKHLNKDANTSEVSMKPNSRVSFPQEVVLKSNNEAQADFVEDTMWSSLDTIYFKEEEDQDWEKIENDDALEWDFVGKPHT
ncbi:hypothetical protein GQ44DRAFT_756166 [Phaeosphaeriaceae sp. PMI808]|nr:hypothetical protein GQ44DRAFT_756166 [Phaeosphaeriaceae sp. PMI808]